MRHRRSTHGKDVTPFAHIARHYHLRLQAVGQYATGLLRRSATFDERKIVRLRSLAGELPLHPLYCANIPEYRLDNRNFLAEFIAAIIAIARALLAEGGNTMADQLVTNSAIYDEANGGAGVLNDGMMFSHLGDFPDEIGRAVVGHFPFRLVTCAGGAFDQLEDCFARIAVDGRFNNCLGFDNFHIWFIR